MKKVLHLFLTVSFFVICTENSRGEEFHKVQLGVTFSPNYAYRTLKGDSESFVLQGRNEHEIAKFGFSGGLNVGFNPNSWFGIESGILYTNKGYRTEKDYFKQDQEVAILNNSQWIRTVYSFHYIDIPLKMRFSARLDKISFFAAAGITTGFLAVQKNTIQCEREKDSASPNYASHYNRINLSPTVSAGIDYKVTSKSSLRIEPIYRYGVLNINKDSGPGLISQYLWDAGVSVSYLVGIR